MGDYYMSKNSSDKPWVRVLLTCLGIVGLWIWVSFWVFPLWVSDSDVRSEWGESFGGINALFSGLAFACMFWAVYFQIKELQFQRIELQNTRKEIKGQKEQLSLQNKTLRRQNFESSFFQLFDLHNNIIDTMKVTSTDSFTYERRKCFLARLIHEL